MNYTFNDIKTMRGMFERINAEKNVTIPEAVVDCAEYHLEFVEECYRSGACGTFYLLMNDKGIESEEYNTLLMQENLNGDDYEFDDEICQDNDCKWRIRAFVGTDAYWVFLYYSRDIEGGKYGD